jgi:hypothetical protein
MVVRLTTISRIPALVSLGASQGISHPFVLTSSHETSIPLGAAKAASGRTSSSRQQVKTPTNVQGRVNHATAREAQESPNVLLSMILANSAPACALSELGASHSFVTIFFLPSLLTCILSS